MLEGWPWGLSVIMLLLGPSLVVLALFLALQRGPRVRKPATRQTAAEPRQLATGPRHLMVLAWVPDRALPAPFAASSHALILARGTADAAARGATRQRLLGPGRFEPIARISANRPELLLAYLRTQFQTDHLSGDLYQVERQALLDAITHARFAVPGVEINRIEDVAAEERQG
jgi:hypothetical protein